MNTILFGDCRETLRTLAGLGVKAQMCVTSPPYFGLRNYSGGDREIGREATPDQFITNMVDVFREVRRMLADDGVLWLNLGDSYGKGKQLLGMPWRVALALQADGWILRQDIIWNKPNPMPEPVRDRCTKAHEYVFLLSKSERYYYDANAVREPISEATKARWGGLAGQRINPRSSAPDRNDYTKTKGATNLGGGADGMRNRRSVWTVLPQQFVGAHFATFPPALIAPCVLAGSRPGDIVLDPFIGSGTTAAVAIAHGRQYLGCELNPEYKVLQDARILAAAPVAANDAAQLSLLSIP